MKENWQINRRRFIKGMVAAGIVSKIGFLTACSEHSVKIEGKHYFFSDEEVKTLEVLLELIFPDNGNGPSIKEINALPHIIWTMQDEFYGYNTYELIKSSLHNLKELTDNNYKAKYTVLDVAMQSKIIEDISQLKWGDKFLSSLATYIFEAMAIDPQYNVNLDGVGWKWLDHMAGQPKPTPNQLYPQFLNKLGYEI
ncbi:MAG: gluconate 2-dehydrogenase subunit 3 family protein [Putridiphycobacter sp.]|nr:gluconate 2-dehydrogenase subunit 3 family protein [Putridiphycobacter sp.]